MSKPKKGRGLKDAFIALSFEQTEEKRVLQARYDKALQAAIELAEDHDILENAARCLTKENAWLVEKLLEVSPKQRKVTEDRQKSKATRETNLDKKYRPIREAAIERWKKKPLHTPHAVAKYLIDEEITTLKKRQVTTIIEGLKPSK